MCNVLKAGPIPHHVAFILDGNRRYARKMGWTEIFKGHEAGFEKLAKTLEWCRDLGIKEVTVYAFSIENFKRSDSEVSGLMHLAAEKFQEILDEKEKLEKHKVCIRFLGDLSLLPDNVRRLAAKIVLLTKDYSKHFLNVCIAYTSQNEITRAFKDIAQGVDDGLIDPEDVSEDLISSCLDSRSSPDPDLLVRTSGEIRFSDFLLWQCTYSCTYFDRVLWPEFSFWNLCCAVLHYQRHYDAIQDFQQTRSRLPSNVVMPPLNSFLSPVSKSIETETRRRCEKFLRIVDSKRLRELAELAVD